MNVLLLDIQWKALLPLCFGKPIGHLLIGMDSVEAKWKRYLSSNPTSCSAAYLHSLADEIPSGSYVVVNSSLLPNQHLADSIKHLATGEILMRGAQFLAGNFADFSPAEAMLQIERGEEITQLSVGKVIDYAEEIKVLNRPADIFAYNDAILRQDFDELTKGMRTIDLPKHVTHTGNDLFAAPGAIVHPCYINTTTGPVYIAEKAEVMEGAMLRGPLYIGEGTTIKMGAKIYGATSIGAHCRAGGELNNVVMQAYSNKGHDGFLGNSVIGSWCNLGADTNTSNLKNNYGNVRVWSYEAREAIDSELQFHGLIMGDHSKAGINTMFNTGTVVGMNANIFNAGFPPKFIPSFAWMDAGALTESFRIEKAIEVAEAMMSRRNLHLSEQEKAVFKWVSQYEAENRR